MVQYNVVVVYAFSIHFNRFYRAILVENSNISNDYKMAPNVGRISRFF